MPKTQRVNTASSKPPVALLLISLVAGALALNPVRLRPTPMSPDVLLQALPADLEVGLAVTTADPAVRKWLGMSKALLELSLKYPKEDDRGAIFYRRRGRDKAEFFITPPPSSAHPLAADRDLTPLFAELPKPDLAWLVVRRPGLNLVASLSLKDSLVTCRWVAEFEQGPRLPPGQLNFETLDFFTSETPYLALADVGRILEHNPAVADSIRAQLQGYHLDLDEELLTLLGAEMAYADRLAVFHLYDPAGWKELLRKKLPPIVSSDLATFYRQGASITSGLDDTIAWATTADFAIFGLDEGLKEVEAALKIRHSGESLWGSPAGAWLRAQAKLYDLLMAVRQEWPGIAGHVWLAIESSPGRLYRGIGCLELEESTIR